MNTVLVVDDDLRLLEMLRRTLSYAGYEVVTAATGPEALAAVEAERPDVVVLDWMLPGLDGPEVTRRIRQGGRALPILMLTARDAVDDRVAGLDSGADDYLVKPFAPEELSARIRALLRRADSTRDETPLNYADLTLDPVTRVTRRGDRTFELTPTEFALLQLFLRHPERVLRRAEILEAVWGYDFGGEDNVLEVYVGYIRRKTEAAGEPRLVQTVRGVGYVLRSIE